MHTYIHTYIHTHIHTYIHHIHHIYYIHYIHAYTYINTYMQTQRHSLHERERRLLFSAQSAHGQHRDFNIMMHAPHMLTEHRDQLRDLNTLAPHMLTRNRDQQHDQHRDNEVERDQQHDQRREHEVERDQQHDQHRDLSTSAHRVLIPYSEAGPKDLSQDGQSRGVPVAALDGGDRRGESLVQRLHICMYILHMYVCMCMIYMYEGRCSGRRRQTW